MAKKFVLFTIKKRVPLIKRLQKFALNVLPAVVIIVALIMKLNYLIVIVLLFLSLMLRKLFKVFKPEQIEVYYDHMIFTNSHKQLEVEFYHIHYIDIDVHELPNGEKYIKELVLLNGAEQELFSIDGEGYEKEHLDFLISRIQEVQATIAYR